MDQRIKEKVLNYANAGKKKGLVLMTMNVGTNSEFYKIDPHILNIVF
jgi:hypothetical protein